MKIHVSCRSQFITRSSKKTENESCHCAETGTIHLGSQNLRTYLNLLPFNLDERKRTLLTTRGVAKEFISAQTNLHRQCLVQPLMLPILLQDIQKIIRAHAFITLNPLNHWICTRMSKLNSYGARRPSCIKLVTSEFRIIYCEAEKTRLWSCGQHSICQMKNNNYMLRC